MWVQWLERTLNAHDADAYAVRRAMAVELPDHDGMSDHDDERADAHSAACCPVE